MFEIEKLNLEITFLKKENDSLKSFNDNLKGLLESMGVNYTILETHEKKRNELQD